MRTGRSTECRCQRRVLGGVNVIAELEGLESMVVLARPRFKLRRYNCSGSCKRLKKR